MDEEKNIHPGRFEDVYGFSILLWGIFHIWASIYNGLSSIDKGYGHSYDWKGLLLTVAYLVVLLSFCVLMAIRKDKAAAKIVGRYWLISGIICLIAIIRPFSEMGGVLLLLISPVAAILPITDCEFFRAVPKLGQILALGFCLLNWFSCRWVLRNKG